MFACLSTTGRMGQRSSYGWPLGVPQPPPTGRTRNGCDVFNAPLARKVKQADSRVCLAANRVLRLQEARVRSAPQTSRPVHCREHRMTTTFASVVEPFVDRRGNGGTSGQPPERERRQFSNSHEALSPDARELAQAIDSYKLVHRRRFITYEEMLAVVKSLGYSK